ncbi:hypothetical protein Tco_0555669 [Tanacetum coccineum]
MEDQPLPADASPTALSPGYIADSDPEEDEEDPEEDPADHPADGGDNDDNESSDDDDDDDDVEKDEEDEEEEHLAPHLLRRLSHLRPTKLLAADRRRQAQFIEALKLLKGLQTQMTEFHKQQGPAKGPAQPDAPGEAGSSS